MMPDLLGKALLAVAAALATAGAAFVTVAQGVLDPTALAIERLVGGGVLAGVAILIVRWSRQMSKEVRETLTASLNQTQNTLDQTVTILETEREAWAEERAGIKQERDQLRRELIETQTLLREERNLRLSLERAGVADRRHTEIPEDDRRHP